MSFENLLGKSIDAKSISRVRFAYKDMPHISKSAMQRTGGYAELKIGASIVINQASKQRYVYASNVIYDAILSLYYVNAQLLFVGRFFSFSGISKDVEEWLKPLKGKERFVEARLIGMQDASPIEELQKAMEAIKGVPIMEADLFGSDIRHIAIDSKLGTSFFVFELDRAYRPGELSCNVSIEDFKSTMLK
ncbi:MAG: hypothetical protein QXY10_02135 [Candidatus Micrarchaeaceae archaeon]